MEHTFSKAKESGVTDIETTLNEEKSMPASKSVKSKLMFETTISSDIGELKPTLKTASSSDPAKPKLMLELISEPSANHVSSSISRAQIVTAQTPTPRFNTFQPQNDGGKRIIGGRVKADLSFSNFNKDNDNKKNKENDNAKKDIRNKDKFSNSRRNTKDWNESDVNRTVKKYRKKEDVQKRTVQIYDGIEISSLASDMAINVTELLKKLKQMGINTKTLDADTAELIVMEYGHQAQKIHIVDPDADPVEDYEGEQITRAPVVTIVGHVDHGKTSLLDTIRQTSIATKEAGGITQSIGAYQVQNSHGKVITFLDTPGHETFTSMRERGVQATDIAILVIAADDGIKDQTIEAIKHIKAANVEIIVAITKVDKPTANPDKIEEALLQYDIVTEKFSGSVVAIKVSSHKNIGITELLDAITIQSDVMELKARTQGHAIGVVLESSMLKGMGHIANTLIQKGTLKLGDNFVIGSSYGKVKCLIDCNGKHIKQAGPSVPVSIIGLISPVLPADRMVVVPNEQIAKNTAENRINKPKVNVKEQLSLEEMYARMQDQGKKLLVLLKADTVGSLEALKQGVESIKNDEVSIKVISSSSGLITESDIKTAETFKSILVAFNLKPSAAIKQLAIEKYVHILSDDVIYRIFESLQATIDKMMKPIIKQEVMGKAMVIKLFSFSKGTVAGCRVIEGKMSNGLKLRLIRKDEIIEIGSIKSLQKATESAKEATKGQECGIMTENYNEYQLNDILECYVEQIV